LNVVWNELCRVCGLFRNWQFQPPSSNWTLSSACASRRRRGSSPRKYAPSPSQKPRWQKVDALEQERAVDVAAWRHEPAEQPLRVGRGSLVAFG
jgi:hypothetical protein